MNKEKLKVPKLRFKEFSGEWEEKKVKNICNMNPKSEKLPEKFIYIDLESVENGILKNQKMINLNEAPSRAQRLLETNDILYQTVRPYQKNNLFFNISSSFKFVASTGYAQLRAYESSKFLYHYLHNQKFVDSVIERCTGTSYPAINSSDFGEITLFISTLPEQQKIADFLSEVDEKIEKLTKKKELLEQYKKGVMQKIFSQDIRFKDDNGNDFPEWEEKELGEICEFINGKAHENVIDNDGSYIVINSKFIASNGTIYKKSYENLSPVQRGSLTLVMSDVPRGKALGKCYLILDENKFTLNQRICELRFDNNDSKFLFYIINRNNHFLSFDSGVGQTNLKKEDVLSCPLFLPSLPEQQKIADFLSALDKKIDIVDKELGQVQEFKKGLLQQMFV